MFDHTKKYTGGAGPEVRSLLIGCGNSREKKVRWDGKPEWAGALTTIDMDPNCGADVVWDLDKRPYPFPDECFDEMGCYDVLEHLGRQGDWRGWFDEMAEFHRILKPGGVFGILVPIGEDALGDPGHTRFFQANYFGFLSQQFYVQNLANGTACTDYRWYWKRDFEVLYLENVADHHLACVLRKA